MLKMALSLGRLTFCLEPAALHDLHSGCVPSTSYRRVAASCPARSPIRAPLPTDQGADCSLCATANGKCTARQPRLGEKGNKGNHVQASSCRSRAGRPSQGVQGVQKASKANVTSPGLTAT
ncbi:hypothetical protein BBK36DRAFT_1138170 [Trichoderma citrinoviride]|uniref:Uncharacterized protein n=1 Tax=Trichoderma citrinoviride TaxID=58853 RepID=A0A2T4BKB5_9HYPO|nr:hypothetical protein BBK36DRAFT_1138170 [Trichoderma citrinoviride]PTB69750.1 hypothetical protein BBK36DRAFT_1138170 [Trichoderma citrinoviride]